MRYKFEVTIEDGCDEFWESNPSPNDLAEQIKDDLNELGWNSEVSLLAVEDDSGQLMMKLDGIPG
jgi:hypothetical protein